MAVSRDGGYASYDSAGTSKFIPQLYAMKLLKKYYARTVFKEICNTDYEGEFRNKGDKIIIRKSPDITVNDYNVGQTITYEVPEEANTEMSIDKAKYLAFRCDDIDKVEADISLVNTFADDAHKKLNIAVDTDVLAVMGAGAAAANKGQTAGAISGDIDLGTTGTGGADAIQITTANAVDYIVTLNQILDEQNIDDDGRFVVIPAWFASLLKTGDLRRADITGDSKGVIRSGAVGMIDRTTVYVNNNLDTTTEGAVTCFNVIAGTKEATSFAMQLSKVDTLKIPDSFGEYWRTLYVYGRKVTNNVALTNLYCKK